MRNLRFGRTGAVGALKISAALALVGSLPAAADSTPSGQRFVGQSVVEPVYDDEQAGEIGYVLQPLNAPQPVEANTIAWAPLDLVVYPVGSAVPATTVLQCQHLPVDNCPTNGGSIASFALSKEPLVYAAGVAGRDHLMDFPGGPDYNVAWEPVVVLFTPKAAGDGAINQHVLTDAQISNLLSSGAVVEFARPTRSFDCASVSEAVYERASAQP